jgi:hypothetical protein
VSEMPVVSPEPVVEILTRDPLGAALWRAAAAEAVAQAMAERIDQLEQQAFGKE